MPAIPASDKMRVPTIFTKAYLSAAIPTARTQVAALRSVLKKIRILVRAVGGWQWAVSAEFIMGEFPQQIGGALVGAGEGEGLFQGGVRGGHFAQAMVGER